MRLICPNCEAEYEVPDAVIPAEGRDVQCSDCGQTWFQHHPDNDPTAVETPDEAAQEDAPDVRPAPPPPGLKRTQRKVEDSVQEILREEAQRETAAREREADNLESQPDLGLEEDDFEKRNRDARNRLARLRGDKEQVDASGSRRDLLPDIEEINSSLRSTNDRRDKSLQMSDIDPKDLDRRGGFWSGFTMIVVLMAVAIGVYLFAPQIAKAFPQADPWLSTYVSKADTVRVWLNGHLGDALDWLEKTAASQES